VEARGLAEKAREVLIRHLWVKIQRTTAVSHFQRMYCNQAQIVYIHKLPI
jgi:hypothetical protein